MLYRNIIHLRSAMTKLYCSNTTLLRLCLFLAFIVWNFVIRDMEWKGSDNRVLFEDKHFKRVLEAFKNNSTNRFHAKTIFKQGNIPVFLLVATVYGDRFWRFQLRHISSNECPFKCNYTRSLKYSSSVDAILVHLESFQNKKSVENYLPKRDPNIPWVMLALESPDTVTDIPSIEKDFNFYFNRTMTYREDSDVILNHGFIVPKEDAKLLPYHWRVSGEYECRTVSKPNRTVIGTLISDCIDKSGRLQYVRELQKNIKVDVYGKCGTLKCGQPLYGEDLYKTYSDECLRKVGTSYLFYLAFENSFCKDYGSEKIYNLLYYPIVPIVYGGVNYEEILPPNSYINAANYTPAELADYINYLVSNMNEYNKYLRWREYYVPSTIGGERVLCDLCTRLYDKEFYSYNVVQNYTKWFVLDANCFKYSK